MRPRTGCALCADRRRSILVRSSGSQVPGRKSAASSCARIRAPTLSVFTFATAVARVLTGLEITTRAPCGSSSTATADALPVASSATWSSPRGRGRELPHRFGSASHTGPQSVTNPSSTTATWAKSRWMSKPMNRPILRHLHMRTRIRCGD